KDDRGGVDKGFETRQLDTFQTHRGVVILPVGRAQGAACACGERAGNCTPWLVSDKARPILNTPLRTARAAPPRSPTGVSPTFDLLGRAIATNVGKAIGPGSPALVYVVAVRLYLVPFVLCVPTPRQGFRVT